ncbi:MAG: LON peptidase substrate-binding domain-containing protein, partial [Oscillospiraceae bacterium]|nr:LON peptidase substrate-binding domain-containing protein [Oscillospiraceae bacterium]
MSAYTVAKLPVLALRGMSIFPEQTVHFDVGRLKSALALEHAMKHDQTLFLVPQKDILVDDPGLKDLHGIGTVVKVKQILKTQGDNVRVLVTGVYRARILELTQNEPFLSGTIDPVDEVPYTDNLKTKALRREAVTMYGNYSDMLEHPVQGVQLRI